MRRSVRWTPSDATATPQAADYSDEDSPTSRHKKAKALAPLPIPAPPPNPAAELLRRALLGLTTALIVARALLPGEDVGLLEPGANPVGLASPLLWLCGLASWTAWRVWSRRLDWYGGLVELGLLGVVLSAFLSTAAVASYQHPAWVVSWEWAGLLAAFFLVRQIARSAADQRGLLAVLLAVGVSLAAQSVYQHVLPDTGRAPLAELMPDELPRRRCEVLATCGTAPLTTFPGTLSLPALAAATSESDPTLFERSAVRNNVRPETGRPLLPQALRPTPPQPPTATFAAASNLAGCLALLLPALAGCALAAWLSGAPRWHFLVAVGCALLTALALWLTQVRSAILPCLLVGVAASALAWRYRATHPAGTAPLSPRLLLLLALAGPALLLALAFGLRGRGGQGLDDLTREWSAAWAMIRDHFWLGVGPGNYGRHYPQYMAANAPTFARQPDNFVLEVWATLGLPALLALGVALVRFFRRTLALVPRPSASARSVEPDDGRIRWEFYEGGMVGLLVGFVLRALAAGSSEAILTEALAAGVRALVWFAAYALLSDVLWTGMTRVLACTAGVAALLLHLAFSGGFSVPGVAQPLWVMAALALNGLPEQPLPVGRQLLGRVLPLALATATALMCALQIVLPLNSAESTDRSALAVAQKYLDVRSGVTAALPDGKTERLASVPDALKRIITGLVQAVEEDPANARYRVDAANWFGDLFETFPSNEGYYNESVAYARLAQSLDPLGKAGYLAEARAHQIAARRAPDVAMRSKAASQAPEPLLKIIKSRKYDAQLQYQLAVACFVAEDTNLGKVHADHALKLDAAALAAERRLTDAQRRQAERFRSAPPRSRPLP